MKKSLPYLLTLAACILAGIVLAESNRLLPPGDGSGKTALSQPPLSPPGDAQAVQTTAGDRLLIQVASQLERRVSVTARLRHQISLAGQQLYGVGSYWQQGNGEDLKVRLELQIAGQDAQFLQVCDNRFVWIDRKLPTGRYITRIDLRQLRVDPSLGTSDLSQIRPGEANWSSLQSELTSYTGGLPALLSALRDNFTFLPPQAMRLAVAPPIVPEPTDLPVWAVVGHWKADKLAALLSKNQVNSGEVAPPSKSKKPKSLPERMPQEVLLLVGQANLFPYRIEYRRLETPQTLRDDGTAIPYQLSVDPMVVLELSDVVFDAPIAAGQFDYNPGNADWVDQTTAVLQRLRQKHQAQVATRPENAGAASARQ